MKHENHSMHKDMDMQGMKHEAPVHAMHMESLKTKFFVCLTLTIPVLLFSQAIQTWLHYTLTLPYQTYVLLVLATIIYAYGGWPFLKGLTQELRAFQPGMMTLIGTAISVAFFF